MWFFLCAVCIEGVGWAGGVVLVFESRQSGRLRNGFSGRFKIRDLDDKLRRFCHQEGWPARGCFWGVATIAWRAGGVKVGGGVGVWKFFAREKSASCGFVAGGAREMWSVRRWFVVEIHRPEGLRWLLDAIDLMQTRLPKFLFLFLFSLHLFRTTNQPISSYLPFSSVKACARVTASSSLQFSFWGESGISPSRCFRDSVLVAEGVPYILHHITISSAVYCVDCCR